MKKTEKKTKRYFPTIWLIREILSYGYSLETIEVNKK